MTSSSTMPALLLERAKATPTAPILRFFRRGKWNEVSFETLNAKAALVGGGLLAVGFTSGDVVAVCSQDGPFCLAAELAIQGFGGIALVLDPELSGDETRSRLQLGGAKALLAGDQEQYDKVDEAWSEISELRLLVVDGVRGLGELLRLDRADLDRRMTLSQLEERGSPSAWEAGVASVNAASAARRGRGTDSLTHAELVSKAEAVKEKAGFGPKDSFVLMNSLANDQEYSFAMAASLIAGGVLHFGGPADSGHALRAVQPTVVLGSRSWAEQVATDIDRQTGRARGLKALALRSAKSMPMPASPSRSGPRTFGIAAAAAVGVFWLFSTGWNDVLRIFGALAICVVVGAAFVFSGRSVANPLRVRYGLSKCRSVWIPGWDPAAPIGSLSLLQVPFAREDSEVGR